MPSGRSKQSQASGTRITSHYADVYISFLEARLNPTAANVKEALRQSRSEWRNDPRAIVNYAQTLAQFGHEEELAQILLAWNHPDQVDFITDVLFRPAFHQLHRDRRFISIARRLGLLKFWQATRWPDFCASPDLPYDCRVEAAKLS